MPASDPTFGVPTPTGTLQGVAAFSWDGAAWQPAGRAGPSVATPTGVLQGVAAFNGGPSWQPSGRAGPGVATPSGVLDGVAVYTWSGSAWTPPGGQPAPSTPSGALRGVAAFDWDGTAWQPAGQAGPDVATPYGVLQGVARFNWTGTAWAAVGAPSLSLDFMTPGTLDARITFTRASTATYFNSAGVMQTAPNGAPRWDYDPVTLALKGLLIEEARTNRVLNSSSANGIWGGSSSACIVTPNAGVAPDGTTTATLVVDTPPLAQHAYGPAAVAITSNTVYTATIFLKAAGRTHAELLIIDGSFTNGIFAYVDLGAGTASPVTYVGSGSGGSSSIKPVGNGWYRCSVTGLLDATSTNMNFLTYLDNGGGNYYPGDGVSGLQIWGAQIEVGAFATSYIPTTAAAVTRAADACSMPVGAWYSAIASTLEIEAIFPTSNGSNQTTGDIDDGTTSNFARLFRSIGNTPLIAQVVSTAGGNFYNPTLGIVLAGSINKGAVAWQAGNQSSAMSGALGSPGAGTLIPAGMTTLRIGAIAGPAQILCGWVQRVRYWPRVLSNAELQSVTT